MKILNYYSLIILCLILFPGITSCSGKAHQKEQELKVLAWNIWHGGHSKTYPDIGCEGTIGILKKSEADVILMVETYGAAPTIADSLGYYYELLSSNLCIFSRFPIRNVYTYPDQISTFNFGGVEIDMNGTPVRLFDTWLHYLPDMRLAPLHLPEKEVLAWDDEGTRDEEIRTILSLLKPFIEESDSIPVIIGGDFNSHSHLDWTETTKDLYRHEGAVINWTVSKEMERARFKDSFREINPDPTVNLGITWLYDVGEPIEPPTRMDRIDYIYYQGKNIQATHSEVYNQILGEPLLFKGEEFFYASDHGFVVAKFRID